MNHIAVGILALAASGAWAADADNGKTLFLGKCASCHGKEGKGNAGMAKMFKVDPAALDLTDEPTQSQKDGVLVSILEKGKGKMPVFAGKLKPEELGDLVAYLRILGGSKPAASPAEAPAAAAEKAPGGPAVDGAALFKKSCSACHGKDGKGNAGMAKMFKVEPAALDLTDETTQSQKDGALASVLEKGKGKMPVFTGKLKPEEIEAVLQFVKGLASGK